MNLNYSIEGESRTITIITDTLPGVGGKVKVPDTVIKRHWPDHMPSGLNPYFKVKSVTPVDENNFNIELAR